MHSGNIFIETDPVSAAQIYLLGTDKRPADNIYGEHPYCDDTGRWLAVRYYSKGSMPGGITIIDLMDGSRRDLFTGDLRFPASHAWSEYLDTEKACYYRRECQTLFPAFHAWSEYLYYQQTIKGKLMLRRCRYDTLETEDIASLPSEMGIFSYGTVSPDHQWYAVSIKQDDISPAKLFLLDLNTGQWRSLLDKPGFHAKHEQFSHDGRNRVLIQLNQIDVPINDVSRQVLLAELGTDGQYCLFPADRPYTPRPTGHEAWIGAGDRIFFSTDADPESSSNIWAARAGEQKAVSVYSGKLGFQHVSVSRCGNYWLGDTGEDGRPIYIGAFKSGGYSCLLCTQTVYNSKRWSHLPHPHPYLTSDNQWMIFTSTRGGYPQVYGAKIASGWLDRFNV